jgi:3-dehydroquinate synthase
MSLKERDSLATVEVKLPERTYKILVGYRWTDRIGSIILKELPAAGRDVMVFTSPVIGKYYFGSVASALRRAGFKRIIRHNIPDGDRNKNLREYVRCMEILTKKCPPDTGSRPLLLALGGGVITDLVGFVAGTYGRGNFALCVYVPTTLLACVDSTVGGKTGVNVLNLKNQAGVFYQPHLVLIDLNFLNTLDDSELRAGMAEVIKYGAVCDSALFQLLEERIEDVLKRDSELLQRIVVRCCAIKARIVEKDERDISGIRIVLNFGHTIGHAIESASDFKLRHGEAVAIGMLGATKIGVELGVCNASFYERLKQLIIRAGLPVSASAYGINARDIYRSMRSDKKVMRGVNRFVLPTGIYKHKTDSYMRLINGTWDEVASWSIKQACYVVRSGIDQDIVRKAVRSCIR